MLRFSRNVLTLILLLATPLVLLAYSPPIEFQECSCAKKYGKGIMPVITFDNLLSIVLLSNSAFENEFAKNGFTVKLGDNYLEAYQGMETLSEFTDCYNVFIKNKNVLKVIWTGPLMSKPFVGLTKLLEEDAIDYNIYDGYKLYKFSVAHGTSSLKVHLSFKRIDNHDGSTEILIMEIM